MNIEEHRAMWREVRDAAERFCSARFGTPLPDDKWETIRSMVERCYGPKGWPTTAMDAMVLMAMEGP